MVNGSCCLCNHSIQEVACSIPCGCICWAFPESLWTLHGVHMKSTWTPAIDFFNFTKSKVHLQSTPPGVHGLHEDSMESGVEWRLKKDWRWSPQGSVGECNIQSKGGTGWWLENHFVSPKPQTCWNLSALVFLKPWVTYQVFEPLTRVSDLFPESPTDSWVFLYMIMLFLMYYINTKFYIITLSLYIFIALKLRISYYLTKSHQFMYLHWLTL